MSYVVGYYHARVIAEIEGWPVAILAAYARLVELPMEFGPDVRMPHSRAMGNELFELRPRGREGIGAAFYCHVSGQRVVILHAVVKKGRSTSGRDLAVARTRMREIRHG